MAAQRHHLWRHKRLAAPAIGIGLVVLAALGTASISGASASSPPHSPTLQSQPRAERAADPAPLIAPAPDHASAESGLRRFTAAVGADLSESLHRAGVPAAAAHDYVAQMLRAARLAAALSAAGPRDIWWRAALTIDGTGQRLVTPDARGDSSLQRPLAEANALLRQPADADLGEGEMVQVIALERVS